MIPPAEIGGNWSPRSAVTGSLTSVAVPTPTPVTTTTSGLLYLPQYAIQMRYLTGWATSCFCATACSIPHCPPQVSKTINPLLPQQSGSRTFSIPHVRTVQGSTVQPLMYSLKWKITPTRGRGNTEHGRGRGSTEHCIVEVVCGMVMGRSVSRPECVPSGGTPNLGHPFIRPVYLLGLLAKIKCSICSYQLNF